VLVPEHPSTFVSVNNLVVVLWYRCKNEVVEAMNQRALGVREKAMRLEHLGTLIGSSIPALVRQDDLAVAMNRLEGKGAGIGESDKQ
jgi:hypothetical protein